MNRKIFILCLLCVLMIQLLVFISFSNKKMAAENRNDVVSIFSWYFELADESMFHQLSQPLTKLGVNRIYQLVSADYILEPEMSVMVQNLWENGIETVILTGDASWISDGLNEYKDIVDHIAVYNQNASEDLKINGIALDVEVHTLPEWKKNPKKLFEEYVDLMREAKEYAAVHNLKIIQVIPANYDTVDKELFDVFLKECCDEISIMNYNRKAADRAIKYEFKKCKEYNIPIETIFETMPLSEEHQVTEEITYYYDGMDILAQNVVDLKENYGPELGIAYHHYSTIYEMYIREK